MRPVLKTRERHPRGCALAVRRRVVSVWEPKKEWLDEDVGARVWECGRVVPRLHFSAPVATAILGQIESDPFAAQLMCWGVSQRSVHSLRSLPILARPQFAWPLWGQRTLDSGFVGEEVCRAIFWSFFIVTHSLKILRILLFFFFNCDWFNLHCSRYHLFVTLLKSTRHLRGSCEAELKGQTATNTNFHLLKN